MIKKTVTQKAFGSTFKSKRCENSGVSPLMKDGVLQSDSTSKAKMLNDQFVLVFTDKDDAAIPDLGVSPHPTVPSFSISKEGVRKLLANIKPHTACGPVCNCQPSVQ